MYEKIILYDVDAVCVVMPGPFDYKEGIFRMRFKIVANE